MTAWNDFVKSFARKNKITYGCALTDPRCSVEYHRSLGRKETEATRQRKQKIFEGIKKKTEYETKIVRPEELAEAEPSLVRSADAPKGLSPKNIIIKKKPKEYPHEELVEAEPYFEPKNLVIKKKEVPPPPPKKKKIPLPPPPPKAPIEATKAKYEMEGDIGEMLMFYYDFLASKEEVLEPKNLVNFHDKEIPKVKALLDKAETFLTNKVEPIVAKYQEFLNYFFPGEKFDSKDYDQGGVTHSKSIDSVEGVENIIKTSKQMVGKYATRFKKIDKLMASHKRVGVAPRKEASSTEKIVGNISTAPPEQQKIIRIADALRSYLKGIYETQYNLTNAYKSLQKENPHHFNEAEIKRIGKLFLDAIKKLSADRYLKKYNEVQEQYFAKPEIISKNSEILEPPNENSIYSYLGARKKTFPLTVEKVRREINNELKETDFTISLFEDELRKIGSV